MATQNSANQQFANNADGFTLGGGTTVRSLTVTSGSPTITGGSNTLTLAGNLTTSGAYALTLTLTGTTNVTLPTTGTLEAVKKAIRNDTTGTISLGSSDVICIADATSGTITYNLPAAASSTGQRLYIKKTDSSANGVTIQANGAETIDGNNQKVINTANQCLTVACDGTAWYII